MLTGTLAMVLAAALSVSAARADEAGWAHYGGDAGGKRYSAAAQITPANAGRLRVAWRYSTGDLKSKGGAMKRASFEDTPILADGRLYVCSPFNEVSALDPETGRELWRFDPRLDPRIRYPNDFVCRGVAFWRSAAPASEACAARIFLATNDRRLFALDAATGKPCAGFGDAGSVAMAPEPKMIRPGEVQNTSPPVIARGVVIVGSSIDDNQRAQAPRGVVRGYDAMTGALRWVFDPMGGAAQAGAANVWAPMSVDEARGLVFLPTGSPSPDFHGGNRPGENRNADSVVALDAVTGRLRWAFQVTHHDLWDYDVPAQPTLATLTHRGRTAAAVVQPTKQGLVFTLDRETGVPIIPVEERPAPGGAAPGEWLSPTQPIPVAPPALSPDRIRPQDAYGLTFWDRGACRRKIAGARAEGLYTPPSVQGTILYPFTGGGANWGGLAFDDARGVAYVNTSSVMHLVTLIPRERFDAERKVNPGKEISPQAGTPYGVRREALVSPLGLPCNPPPWGQLHAIDMREGRLLWQVPLGTTEDIVPFSQYAVRNTGTPNFGGPIVTAGGIVFIGAAMDDYLRAFDAATGAELWRGRLPAGGQATPMTYVWKGRQYVVIAAGGHAKSNTKRGDEVIAFALPR